MFGNDVFGIDIMFGVYFCCFIFNIVHFHALPHIWGLGINYARFTPYLPCFQVFFFHQLTKYVSEIIMGKGNEAGRRREKFVLILLVFCSAQLQTIWNMSSLFVILFSSSVYVNSLFNCLSQTGALQTFQPR